MRKAKKQIKKSFNKTRSKEPRNYQDLAEDQEFLKGQGKSPKFPLKDVKHQSNDPQWYFKDSQILKDVASFSFNKPLGTDLRINRQLTGSTTQNSVALHTVPGLMTLHIAPSVGVSIDAQSPLNLAAINVYSYVRYKNSGASNYDAPDLMLYLVAMDSVYAMWNWLKRIYGCASTYNQLNRYEPLAYLLANNVDSDDLFSNLADFRAYLNIAANRISAFCVPATMSYNIRHSWLFSNIYKDSATRKAQTYMYVPAYFYLYDETTSPNGGKLTTLKVLGSDNPYEATHFKVSDLVNMMDTMINALSYSEDIGIMSGDILKAYGEGGLFRLSTIDPDYKVEAVYSREVLTQFENARILSVNDASIANFSITQNPNTNYLTHRPQFSSVTGLGNAVYTGAYLNFHWDNPTPEDVIVASRLQVNTSELPSSSNYTWEITSCGSEFAIAAWMYGYTTSANFTTAISTDYESLKLVAMPVQMSYISIPSASPESAELALAQRLGVIGWLSAFDWHPIEYIGYVIGTASSDNPVNHVAALWDFDNYTYLAQNDIEALNSLALLTEFNVPN